jgi:hypothetical protein
MSLTTLHACSLLGIMHMFIAFFECNVHTQCSSISTILFSLNTFDYVHTLSLCNFLCWQIGHWCCALLGSSILVLHIHFVIFVLNMYFGEFGVGVNLFVCSLSLINQQR